MTDHFEQTIAELQKKLQEQEQEVIKTKDMINRLCEYARKPPLYTDADLKPTSAITNIRSDQFYGQPLARAVREALEMRHNTNVGPASVKEIYEILKQGGYLFETKNEQNAMRGLRISLAKNTALFHKLPNGRFGLVAWYPKIQAARSKEPPEEDEEEVEQSATSADSNDSGDEQEKDSK